MVDLGFVHIVGSPPTLLSLELREILAPPPRGGAEESVMGQSCCGREDFTTITAVVFCHLKKNKLKNKV